MRRLHTLWVVAGILCAGYSPAEKAGGAIRPDDLPRGASPQIVFYLPLDGGSDALTWNSAIPNSTYVYLSGKAKPLYVDGIVGKAAALGVTKLTYPIETVYPSSAGTISFWLKIADMETIARDIQHVGKYGEKRRGVDWAKGMFPFQAGDRFKLKVDALPGVKESGKWHHVVITWDESKRIRRCLLDGRAIKAEKIETSAEPTLRLAIGCWELSYKFRLWNPMVVDEFYVWNGVLSDEEITKAYERGKKGEPSWPKDMLPRPASSWPWPPDGKKISDERPQTPVNVRAGWELGKPLETNAFRMRYSLNGVWRVQPVGEKMPSETDAASYSDRFMPEAGDWGYVEQPLFNPKANPRLYDSEFKKGSAWLRQPLTNSAVVVWLERDIPVPAEWQGRSFHLTAQGVYARSHVYCNSQWVGEVFPWQMRSFDLTPRVKTGETNRLILVSGGPDPITYLIGHGSPLNWGFSHDVFLDVFVGHEAFVKHALVIPSVRDKRVTFDVEVENNTSTELPAFISAAVESTIDPKDRKEFPRQKILLAPSATTGQRITYDWPNPKLWEFEDPHLYTVDLHLFRENGEPMDCSYAIRFGFREIRAEGRQILLNGRPITLRSISHNVLKGPTEPVGYAGTLDSFKRIGMNCHRTTHPTFNGLLDQCLRVADEKGFLVQYCFRTPPESRQFWDDYLAFFQEIVRRYGNNPSVALWQFFSGSAAHEAYQIHPRSYQIPVQVPDNYQCRRTLAFDMRKRMKAIDPTRPIFYYEGGEGGDLACAWFYMGFDIPLQSKEEWPSAWAESDAPPIFNAECALLHHGYCFNWQKRQGLDHPVGKGPRHCLATPILIEYAAMLFGDKAYADGDEEIVRSLSYEPEKRQKYWPAKYPTFWDIKKEFAKRLFSSWRTYGKSYSLHIEHIYCHDEKGNLTPQGEAFVRYNYPVLVYIGGPSGDFVLKDHAFWAGEDIKKQLVVRSDLAREMESEVVWELVEKEKGAKLWEEKRKVKLDPGVSMHPVSFKAPEVNQCTRCTLKLNVTGPDQTWDDAFDIQVFPRPDRLSLKGRIGLLEGPGDTARMLTKAGIRFDRVEKGARLSDYDLLVIGRNAYTPDHCRLLEAIGVDQAVENGLNVIVFEQTERMVMGLKMDDPSLREAFICDRTSGVLAGLEQEDFRNWRGEADLIEAYPAFDIFSKKRYAMQGFFGEDEFWHWSNKGIVSTLMVEKPQRGNFHILVEAGYDLGYTPLLEWQKGKGKVVLCQLDVTRRYGNDPMATILVNRFLSGLSDKAITAAPEAAICFGDAKIEELLSGLNVKWRKGDNMKLALDGKSPLIISLPGFARELTEQKGNVARFVEGGGRILVLPASSAEELAWLPVPVRLEKRNVWKTKPDITVTAGLGMSDFFWREVREMLVVMPGNGVKAVDSGLIAEIRHGKGMIVLCQIAPDMFTDNRAWTKTARVLSVLLSSGGVEAGSPAVVDSQPEERVSPYARPALSFNPYEHTGW